MTGAETHPPAIERLIARSSFYRLAAEAPDEPALITTQGTTVARGELLAAVNRASHALRALGIEAGQAIAIVTRPHPRWFEVVLAAEQIGVTIVPVSTHLAVPEIAYLLGDSDARAAFAQPRYAERIVAAADAAGTPRHARVSLGRGEPGLMAYDDFVDGHCSEPPRRRLSGYWMPYTSGTTGYPKAIQRPPADPDPDVAAGKLAALPALFCGVEHGRSAISPGPVSSGFPGAYSKASLHAGACLALMEHWNAFEALELIERHRIEQAFLVPIMLQQLLALPAGVRESRDVSSLRWIIHAGSPIPVSVKRGLLEWLGPIVHEYYGSSEGTVSSVGPLEWLERPGTVGRPLPGVRVSVRDEAGAELAPGEVGTLWVRVPGGPGFEYRNAPQKTAEVIDAQGYFTAGDLGHVDQDGYLFLADRRVDMFLSGGVNVYPAEIEVVLIEHAEVVDVGVIGIPDEEWGAVPLAVVQPADGSEPGPDLERRILRFAGDRLASYKVPRAIRFAPALPRSDIGKLLRRELRDAHAS